MAKTIFKRLIVALLLLSMLLGVLVGCKRDGEDTEGNGEATTEESGIGGDKAILDELADKDFGGREFKLLTLRTYNDTNHLINKEFTGEPITEVSYQRTEFVEGKYNLKMTLVEDTQENSFVSLVQSNHMGGTNAYDLLYPHPTEGIVPLMTNGYLANLYGLENLDVNDSWYNQKQVANYMSNDKLYILSSDYSIVGQGVVGLVYNKDMYAQYNFDYDVYAGVEQGTWTIAKLNELIKDFSVDTEGNGTYGLQFHEGYTDRFLFAFGEGLSSKDADGKFVKGYNETKVSDIADKIYTLTHDHAGVYRERTNNAGFPTSTMYDNFKNLKSLFITYDVGGLHEHLRSLEFKIGVLPLPKYDETQKDYYSFCAAGFFAIPAISISVEDSALVFDALSRYSNVYMKPEFFETVLLGRMSDSSADYEILERIHSDKIYDFAFTADNDAKLNSMLYNVVIDANGKNTSGYLRSNRNYINELFELMNSIS